MNRRSTLFVALGIFAIFTSSWSVNLWAEEVILEPGWIAGQASVSTGGYKVQTLSVSAYGGGHQSSKSTSQSYTGDLAPLDYSLTVQGGDWDYSVNATATARPNPAYCSASEPRCYQSYTNIYFSSRSFPVAIGETAANDYAATGTIQFQLAITDLSDPAISNTITSWRGYGYANNSVPAGEERTNSRSYTHSIYTPSGTWDMPVVNNPDVRVYASVTIYGTALRDDLTTYNYAKSYGVYTTTGDLLYVDVGTDETNQVVVIPLAINHVAPPPPPVIPPYDYGAVEGTVDLNLIVDGIDYGELLFTYPNSPYSRHYVYGYRGANIFTNPGDYLLSSERVGTRYYRARSYLYDADYSQVFYWPYTDGEPTQDRVTVLKDQTLRKDFISETGILSGQLLFNGSLKTKDLDWYQLQVTGARYYEPGVGWVNQPTYGGSSYETVYPTESDRSFRMFLTPGPWQPYYLRARTTNTDLLGYQGWSDITMYDYNYYYDGNTYDFGEPVDIIGGLTEYENFNYKIGGVSMCFQVAGGGTLHSPYVYGNAYLYNDDGKREMQVNVSGASSPPYLPDPEVIIYGPEGDYSLTPRAYTEDNTRIYFPSRQVALNQQVFKRRCLTSPDMTIDNYEFELTTDIGTGTATATVTGNANDDDGILRIEFLVDGDQVHVIDYGAGEQMMLLAVPDGTSDPLPTSVEFSYDFELTAGLHMLRVVAVDGLGNESYDEWEVEVNSAPVAGDDTLETAEDTPLNIPVATLLANDSDNDGDNLVLDSFTAPTQGELVDNDDGSLTYEPNLNYWGSDSFTYTISDGRGGTATATVTINLLPVNDPPLAEDDAYTTDEDVPLVVAAPGVAGNDSDVDGDGLAVSLEAVPANGTVSMNSDGSFTYTANADYNGLDSFSYVLSDGNGGADTGTVSVTINAVNDPPVVSVNVSSQSVQYSDWIIPVTINAADIDSEPSELTVSWTELPSTLVLSGGCSPSGDGSTCAWTLEGQVLVSAGTYPMTITLTDGEYASSKGTDVIVVAEDASAAFDELNAVSVRVVADGGNSDAFSLVAHVTESVPDLPTEPAAPGDIALAEVNMSLMPVGSGGAVSATSCAPDDSIEGTRTVICSFNDVPVETYTVEVTIDGGYYTGSAEDVLTVYDPSLGFTTGGGWFYWPNPDGSQGTDKTNFGYTMKYGNNGQNVKGSLLLIRHLADGQKYRIKSNALEGLAIGQDGTYGWASFSGKSTYLEPGMPEPEGNHGFTVYVEDRNEPGSGNDRFWITSRAKDGGAIPAMSLAEPAPSNAVAILGGNIVAPH